MGCPWHHRYYVLSWPVCLPQKHRHLGLFFWSQWETSAFEWSCWCRVSPPHLLHVRQVEDMFLEGLELR